MTVRKSPRSRGPRSRSGDPTIAPRAASDSALWLSLVESTHEIVLALDARARITFVNRTPPWVSREEILGSLAYDWIPAEHQARVRETLERILETGEPMDLETMGAGPHGTITRYRARVGPLRRRGRTVGLIAMARDVGAVQELQRTKEQLEATVAARTEELTGVVELLRLELAQNSRAQERLRASERQLQGAAPFEFAHRVVWSNGEVRAVHCRGEVIVDDTGHPVRMLGTCQDVTEERRAEGDLRRSREELRALAAHLQSVREEERARIAREIHDDLGQSLTALKMDLAWLGKHLGQGPSAAAKAAEAMRFVDETIDKVRRISAELRPGILDHLGLSAAVEWQCREFEERTGIPCLLEEHLGDERLHGDLATALFRILQESLTNVARHAHARRVDVALWKRDGRIVLEVKDDGKGMKVSSDAPEAQDGPPTLRERRVASDRRQRHAIAVPSLGLLGMRERALPFGGEVSIRSGRGEGTTVTVSVPLRGAEPTS